MNNISVDQLYSDLMKEFNQYNMVLYVGTGVKSDELSEEVCALPWSCIVTSRTERDFLTKFVSETTYPREYLSYDEGLPGNIFNRITLPVFRLFGEEGVVDPDVENMDEEELEAYQKERARKMLSYVMTRLDIRSRMVVIGYDADNQKEYPRIEFTLSWKYMQGGRIDFYIPGTLSPSMAKLKAKALDSARNWDFQWYDISLEEIVRGSQQYDFDREDADGSKNDFLFYKGQKSAKISKNILLRSKNFAQLLTEEDVFGIRPFGRIQQSRYFYRFLNDSAEGPQWYGYLPQSDFYLKRSYEDVLVDTVRALLANKQPVAHKGVNTPVILEGDPGSSKSIELGALAYRVFNEKINPVIFIKNDNLSFSSQSSELIQLDELMQEIEQVGEKDTRTLIIWDSSSYRNVLKEAGNLITGLENRGRRFVLVCSAYSNSHAAASKHTGKAFSGFLYSHDASDRFTPTNRSNPDVDYDGKRYFVKASRTLTQAEKIQLKRKAALYSVVAKDRLQQVWTSLETNEDEKNDIFFYFYNLIVLIRPKLEKGLSREQRLVNEYVRKQLDLMKPEADEEIHTHTMMDALREAGIDLSEEERASIEKYDEEEDEALGRYNLDKFNACIALFGRFKLDTPYELAIDMLCDNREDTDIYNNYALFDVLTTQISYIHYLENENGHFVFRFRNSLEADIFLRKNQVDEEKQIEMILELLDYYARMYRLYGVLDDDIKNSIERLLRMIGPNTDYIPFQKGGMEFQTHQEILKRLNVVIDQIHKIRTEDGIPDEDASLAAIEVTFLREYYGGQWDRINRYSPEHADGAELWKKYPDRYTEAAYLERMRKLQDASDLALESIDKLERYIRSLTNGSERRHAMEQRDSLSVETAHCNRSLERLQEEYAEYCRDNDISPSKESMQIKPLSYMHLQESLMRVIDSSPLNGYAYNALFSLFEKEYEKSDEENQIKLLSEIQAVADEANTLDIVNRGMNDTDELSRHLYRIASFSSKHPVSIRDILDGSASPEFKSLFESMLEKNNPAGICFVCQQELDKVGLSGRKIAETKKNSEEEFVLNEKQTAKCREIIDFITRPEFESSISGSTYAQYVLLNTEWMCFNRRPIDAESEKQLTYIQNADWFRIERVCSAYESCAGNNKKPIVSLIHALSIIQTRKDYNGANSLLIGLSENAFYATRRMRVPYLICFRPGVPQLYSGTVISVNEKNYSGYIRINEIPGQLQSYRHGGGARFYLRNLGLRMMPPKNTGLKNLELGVGYTGFSVYKENISERG